MKQITSNSIIKAEAFLFDEAHTDANRAISKGLTLVTSSQATLPSKSGQQARKEALNILAKARREANELLAKAQAEAEKIRESAYNLGYEEGLLTGKEQGTKDGMTEGMAVGWRSGLEKAQGALDLAHRVLQEARDARDEALGSLEGQMLQLSLAIAEKLTRREIRRDETYLKQMVAAILQEASHSGRVVVRIAPIEGQEGVAQTLQELTEQVQIVVDEKLEPGDVIVESEAGIFDGSLETRLKEIRTALEAVESDGNGA